MFSADTRSFERDWQLLKLSRDWKPVDRSALILQKLMEDNDPIVISRIEAAMKSIARADAESIMQRVQTQDDISNMFEAILLLSGIAYDTEGKGADKHFLIKKEMKSGLTGSLSYSRINAAYIRSFIETIAPKSQLTDKGEYFSLTIV